MKKYQVTIGIIIVFLMAGIAAATVQHVRESKYGEAKDESGEKASSLTSLEETTVAEERETVRKTAPEHQEPGETPSSQEAESTAAPEPAQTEESVSAPEQPATEEKEAGFRRVGYFTSWSAYAGELSLLDVDSSLLTHLNFAFANLGRDGAIQVGDPKADTQMTLGGRPGGHFGQIPAFKAKYPGVKLLLSVGGWSWSKAADTVLEPGMPACLPPRILRQTMQKRTDMSDTLIRRRGFRTLVTDHHLSPMTMVNPYWKNWTMRTG